MTPEEINLACRCQILTGVNVEGSCRCQKARHCVFTVKERQELRKHPTIINTSGENRKRCEKISD